LSAIQKVEIVVPAIKLPKRERFALILAKLAHLAGRTLIVFWFAATWFPELGLTYWGLVLPVYIASWLLAPITIRGRFIPADRLQATGLGTEFKELTLSQRKK
jgi:hypothetical protein